MLSENTEEIYCSTVDIVNLADAVSVVIMYMILFGAYVPTLGSWYRKNLSTESNKI